MEKKRMTLEKKKCRVLSLEAAAARETGF